MTHSPAFSRHLVALVVIVKIIDWDWVNSYCIEGPYGIFNRNSILDFSQLPPLKLLRW